MNDELRVGVRNGFDHADEEQCCGFGFEAFFFDVIGDRLTLHVFDGDVRLRSFINACVIEPRDARMLKARENVAFAGKASGKQPVEVFNERHFERDLPRVLAVGTLRQPHHTHATTAQLFDQSIWADVLAGFSGGDSAG